MAAEGGQIALYVSYQGPYTWGQYEASTIDFEMRNGDAIFAAHVNKQLPATSKPERLQLEMGSKAHSVLYLPLRAAKRLHKISIKFFQTYSLPQYATIRPQGRFVFEQPAGQATLSVELPKVDFEAGGQYEIKIRNESDDFSVSTKRSGEMQATSIKPPLTTQLLFNHISKELSAAGSLRGVVPFQLVRDRVMEGASAFLQNECCAQEVLALSEMYDTHRCVLTGNQEHDDEVLGLLHRIMEGLQMALPNFQTKAAFEEIMPHVIELYQGKRWSELFTLLDGTLPVLEDDHPELTQEGLYMVVCNFALRDYEHDLLIYAFTRMPAGSIKEEQRQRYKAWLESEGMVLPLSDPANSYEELAIWIQHNSRSVVLGLRTHADVVARALGKIGRLSIEGKKRLQSEYFVHDQFIGDLKYIRCRKELVLIRDEVFGVIERELGPIELEPVDPQPIAPSVLEEAEEKAVCPQRKNSSKRETCRIS